MLVLRFEDTRGLGPFRKSEVYAGMSYAVGDERYHDKFDNPNEEGLNFTYDHKCGCICESDLTEWFPPVMQEYLESEGYSRVAYEVPDAYVELGEIQCIFVAEYAERIEG